jgi:hypothetical protein
MIKHPLVFNYNFKVNFNKNKVIDLNLLIILKYNRTTFSD